MSMKSRYIYLLLVSYATRALNRCVAVFGSGGGHFVLAVSISYHST